MEGKKIFYFYLNDMILSEGVWAGWTDELEEGHFKNINDINTNETLEASLWDLSEPNGHDWENCAYLEEPKLWDISCDKEACAVCDLRSTPKFTFRGLCLKSVFDQHFGWVGQRWGGQRYAFRGFENSLLMFEEQTNRWKLQYNLNMSVYAYFNQTDESYPLGFQTWYFVNDEACLNNEIEIEKGIYSANISFSICDVNDFNCDDGTW